MDLIKLRRKYNGTPAYICGVVAYSLSCCRFSTSASMWPENMSRQWDGIEHNMEYVTYKAIEFIEDHADKDDDWFLYVNPTVPHPSSNVTRAIEVDCRVTIDGDYSIEGTANYMPTGWSIEGMTKEFGDDCFAYRNTVKERVGDGSRGGQDHNADLGSICKCWFV